MKQVLFIPALGYPRLIDCQCQILIPLFVKVLDAQRLQTLMVCQFLPGLTALVRDFTVLGEDLDGGRS